MGTDESTSAPASTTGRGLARASWITFLVILVGTTLVWHVLPILMDFLALFGGVVGLASGVVALCFIGREGRKGILWPAILGVVLNGLLLFIWVSNFLAYRGQAG